MQFAVFVFFSNCIYEHTFSVSLVREAVLTIRRMYTLQQYVHHIPKTKDVLFFITCFIFFIFTIWNQIIVSKNSLQWSCLPNLKLERPLEGNLKFKCLDQVWGMLLYFGILKICGFVCLCENKFYIVVTIMAIQANKYC